MVDLCLEDHEVRDQLEASESAVGKVEKMTKMQ